MGKKISKIICDTGVISRMISGDEKYIIAENELLLNYNIVITTVTKIELYNWIYDYKSQLGEKNFNIFLKKINQFEVIKIDNKTSDIAEKLAVKCFKSGVGDLLTAAIGIRFKLKIFTINFKHFKTIPKANLYFPPNFNGI